MFDKTFHDKTQQYVKPTIGRIMKKSKNNFAKSFLEQFNQILLVPTLWFEPNWVQIPPGPLSTGFRSQQRFFQREALTLSEVSTFYAVQYNAWIKYVYRDIAS